ncbi:LOW QUALITY PROTEIN: hypothetical protein HZS_5386 [Henneguya salminicola]|nr:LOW QUALITY PROTEIN: hypothetical protein HZS_5386 [Henneguya salminicola]
MSDSNQSIIYSSQEESPATVQNTEHMDNRERKQRISLDKRYLIPHKEWLLRMKIRTLSSLLQENEPNATFMSYYNKPGRKLTDNKGLINTIKDVITIDNSYTQVSNKTQLENINFSKQNLKSYQASRHKSKTPKKERINYSFSRSSTNKITICIAISF